METRQTYYATEPAAVIFYPDRVAVNENIVKMEKTYEHTEGTFEQWVADTTFMTHAEWQAIYHQAEEQYKEQTIGAILAVDELACINSERLDALEAGGGE